MGQKNCLLHFSLLLSLVHIQFFSLEEKRTLFAKSGLPFANYFTLQNLFRPRDQKNIVLGGYRTS
jgi:hypothetical protein